MINQEEHRIQCAIVDYLVNLENLGLLTFFAIINGVYAHGKTPVARGKAVNKLKREGMRPGVPDIQIIANDQVFFLETKTKTGVFTPSQKIMIPKFKKFGVDTYIVRSIADVEKTLKARNILK